jgi:hypothetical protein
LQETGTGIILGGGSCGRRVSIKVAIPAGFKGVFDVRAQNGGTTNLSTLSGSRRCYIGVQNVSKVYSVVTSVGSFTANSSPNIQYTAPTYPTTFFTTSSNLTYSVNLPNTSALTTGTFYLNAFDYVDNIQTITPSALRTFTLGAAGTTTITSVTVKAYDNSSTTTYTCRYIVAATPPVTLSNNCTLTNLTTSVGTLTPTFATTQTTYTITLPYLTTLPTTLTTANFSYSLPTGATISSSTTAILTATNSVSTLTFVVRAEDNVTTKTYRIIYKLASPDNNANLASLSSSQGTLSPAFSPNTQICYSTVWCCNG